MFMTFLNLLEYTFIIFAAVVGFVMVSHGLNLSSEKVLGIFFIIVAILLMIESRHDKDEDACTKSR